MENQVQNVDEQEGTVEDIAYTTDVVELSTIETHYESDVTLVNNTVSTTTDDWTKLLHTHNAQHSDCKISKKIAKAVIARGKAEYKSAQFPGVSQDAWGILRLRKFLDLASNGTPEICEKHLDSDLLPATHVLRRDRSFDPWSTVISKSAELIASQHLAVSLVTRSTVRQMSDRVLSEAHATIAKIYATNFEGVPVEKDTHTILRSDVIKAAAQLEEELERRDLLTPSETELYYEATKARERHIRYVYTGKVLILPGVGTVFDLPLGSIVVQNLSSVDMEDIGKSVAYTHDRWSPDGSRFCVPMRTPHSVPYTICTAEITDAIVTAKIKLEKGAETPEFTEYFIMGHTPFSGILRVSKRNVCYTDDNLPYVLSADAVDKGWLPPSGESALPGLVELDIPPDYRYWKCSELSDPVNIRDVYVKRTPNITTRLISGDFRCVRPYLHLENVHPVAPSKFAELVVLSPTDIAEKLLGDTAVRVIDFEEVDHVSNIVDDPFTDYFVAAPITMQNEVKCLGRLFKIDGVDDTCFVTSVPIPPHVLNSIKWLDEITDSTVVDSIDTECDQVDSDLQKDASTSEQLQLDMNIVSTSKADTTKDEQYILGVVLEPDIVDAQSDTYSVADVRKAAFEYMEQFQKTGLMHQKDVSKQVSVVESYLAPVDMVIGDSHIKAGTWLLGVHVLSDTLWKAVKSGSLTGFSIGGYAVRTKE
jgi:hypothetical protein